MALQRHDQAGVDATPQMAQPLRPAPQFDCFVSWHGGSLGAQTASERSAVVRPVGGVRPKAETAREFGVSAGAAECGGGQGLLLRS
jgi:hypothetical protein